jgi:hypothetical protein
VVYSASISGALAFRILLEERSTTDSRYLERMTAFQERTTAVRLLAERAVLTRAVCRELLDANGELDACRPAMALNMLIDWVRRNLPGSFHGEPHPQDGLDQMMVPAGCEDLFLEVREGAEVCLHLAMLYWADTPSQALADKARIRDSLAAYWASHPSTVRAPTYDEIGSNM